MELGVDLSHLAPNEYDKIIGVLKRDRELRCLEKERIGQLKQELTCLRKRAALRPGLDANRTCARCLEELGRVLNRGAPCPLCRKKVCKACRQYGDENYDWLCIFCHKRMQLKAISGEWMNEYKRLSSKRRMKPSPGDQLRKALHESQRKQLITAKDSYNTDMNSSLNATTQKKSMPDRANTASAIDNSLNVPGKGRSMKSSFSLEVYENVKSSIPEKDGISNSCFTFTASSSDNSSPKIEPRTSPWNGIEAEPTIPVRAPGAVPLGLIMLPDNRDQWYRDRASSDDGHSTLSIHSQSTSSDIPDDAGGISAVCLSEKRGSPLLKQKAVTEPVLTDNRNSSLETTDSGVCSPVLKSSGSLDKKPCLSSKLVTKKNSGEQKRSGEEAPERCKRRQESESSYSESDNDQRAIQKIGVIFRKVTLKDKKYTSDNTVAADERQTSGSTVPNIHSHSGLLTRSPINTIYNSFSYLKPELTYFLFKIFFYFSKCPGLFFSSFDHFLLHNKLTHLIYPNTCTFLLQHNNLTQFFNSNTCLIRGGFFNIKNEALCDNDFEDGEDDNKKFVKSLATHSTSSKQYRHHSTRIVSRKFHKKLRKKVKRESKSQINFRRRSVDSPERFNVTNGRFSCDLSNNEIYAPDESTCAFHGCQSKLRSRKEIFEFERSSITFRKINSVRSVSVPCMKSSFENWVLPSFYKYRSLDSLLWYLEDSYDDATLPSRRHITPKIMPDHFKLVYISSSTESADSDSELDKSTPSFVATQLHENFLKVHTHIEIHNDIVYIEDSDWEMMSDSNDDLANADKSKKCDIPKNYENWCGYPRTENIASLSDKKKDVYTNSFTSLLHFEMPINFEMMELVLPEKPDSVVHISNFISHTFNAVKNNTKKLFTCHIRNTNSSFNIIRSVYVPHIISDNAFFHITAQKNYCLYYLLIALIESAINTCCDKSYERNNFETVDKITYNRTENSEATYGDALLSCSSQTFLQMKELYFNYFVPYFARVLKSEIIDCKKLSTSKLALNWNKIVPSKYVLDGRLTSNINTSLNQIIFIEKKELHSLSVSFFNSSCDFSFTNFRDLMHSVIVYNSKILKVKNAPIPFEKDNFALIAFNSNKFRAPTYQKQKNDMLSINQDNYDTNWKNTYYFNVVKIQKVAVSCHSGTDKVQEASWSFFRTSDSREHPQRFRKSNGKHATASNEREPPNRVNDSWSADAATSPKALCCSAPEVQVIDLNLGAFKCSRREVPDSAELTAALGWTAFRSDEPFSEPGSVAAVDAFFRDVSPVASDEPEVVPTFKQKVTYSGHRRLSSAAFRYRIHMNVTPCFEKSAQAGTFGKHDAKKWINQPKRENVRAVFVLKSNRSSAGSAVMKWHSIGDHCKKHKLMRKRLLLTPTSIPRYELLCRFNVYENHFNCTPYFSVFSDANFYSLPNIILYSDKYVSKLCEILLPQTAQEFQSELVSKLYCDVEICEPSSGCRRDLTQLKQCMYSEVLFSCNVNNLLPYFYQNTFKQHMLNQHCVRNLNIIFDRDLLSLFHYAQPNMLTYDEESVIKSDVDSELCKNDLPSVLHHAESGDERADCCCIKPCEVPISPSVIDAIMEEISYDDGEIFSSGDELDKLESDTDSQDTVIEGEAFKRMRSVAIKEKILHANEELFGSNDKSFYRDKSKTSEILNLSHSDYINSNVISRPFHKSHEENSFESYSSIANSNFCTQNVSNIHSDLEKNSTCEKFSLNIFGNMYPFEHNINSDKHCDQNATNIFSLSNQENDQELQLSKSLNNFQDTQLSSESSDNGSDGEELILSDTSTSSDEATYIAPFSGKMCYSQPSTYKLHTIMEESCEESDKSSRGATPTSRASSDFHYVSGKFGGGKVQRQKPLKKPLLKHVSSSCASNQKQNTLDAKTVKDNAFHTELATKRLEKYFKSGILDNKYYSYPEDEFTDESGGVSSDEETFLDKTKVYSNSDIGVEYINSLLQNASDFKKKSKPKITTRSIQEKQVDKNSISKHTENTFDNRNINVGERKTNVTDSTCREFTSSYLSPICCDTSSHFTSLNMSFVNCNSDYKNKMSKIKNTAVETTCSSADIENISDDEARYIMTHVMQHIAGNEEINEINQETNDVSPALKILESEITRLMHTVSPASLSAGEPSSSCSSTIGSNNSDYGSDTLESGEESISEDEPIVNESNGQSLVEIVSQNNELQASGNQIIKDSLNSNIADENNKIADPHITDETLYICKQLMASLKKISDTADATIVSDELLRTEDLSAKQYITDQIVSLMQTVCASQQSSPLLFMEPERIALHGSSFINIDMLNNQDRSDSDSPQPNDEKRGMSKSKTPSESGSETTISASISIPSYDDSDRTPTESEISHEMDELYALLESNGSASEAVMSGKFYDCDGRISSQYFDNQNSDDDEAIKFYHSGCDNLSSENPETSLLCGAASQLESLLPISIEERIARYNDAFLNKDDIFKHTRARDSEMRINVILPQPVSESEKLCSDVSSEVLNISDLHSRSTSSESFSKNYTAVVNNNFNLDSSTFSINSGTSSVRTTLNTKEGMEGGVTSVKIMSQSMYSAFKDLSGNSSSAPLSIQHDNVAVTVSNDDKEALCLRELDTEINKITDENLEDSNESVTTIVTALPKVINPKEKASSENDLLVANYRTKSKDSKVSATKSTGNISELENISNKNTFRDTGYYSFKSSEESVLSLDDSASRTSTTSLTQYRSLTSTETIPEEEESISKGSNPAKISLSSGNIPYTISDTSSSKSSTLPLSLRNKLSSTTGSTHRARSSFFSTSGVLRKLTMLRDESGNSLRSSPHGRMRTRARTLSGSSEDNRSRKEPLPQISVSDCNQVTVTSAASSEKDSLGAHDEDFEQMFTYHSRSQMSLSSFGGRSESVTSVYSAAGGGRYGTVTVTGEVLFSLKYNYKAGDLEVLIKECRNLAPVDSKRNRSDPYVKVYLLPDRTKSGKRKTKVKKHTLNPIFDELLKFRVTISELESRTLWLSVWHSDRFGRNDFLGEVMLPLKHNSFETSELKWFPLQERMEAGDTPVSYKGDLILALKYVPPDVTNRRQSKKPGDQNKGALHVLVKEARNLMATRSNGTSDPFCKSYLLPDKSKSGKQKTQVLKKTCSPKWNHTFVYEDLTVNELRDRCLELTIWDYDKITSNDFLGGVRLCLGTGKYQGRDVDWMDSVGEEVSLWYTMLERPNMWVDGSLLLRASMQNRRAT